MCIRDSFGADFTKTLQIVGVFTINDNRRVPGRFMDDIWRGSVFDVMDLPHVAGDHEYLVSLKFHESGWRDEAIYGDAAPIDFPQDIVHFLDAWNPLKRYAGIK